MKQVDEMPASGQFVAVWVDSDGNLCADTMFYDFSNQLSSLTIGQPLGECRTEQIKNAPPEKQLKFFIAD